MASDLSPTLQLAVALIAQGQSIPAYLCDTKPADVHDIARCRLGVGTVDGNGGTITCHKPGIARCLAYDVRGELVISTPTGLPAMVHPAQRITVGPMAFGKDGVPHA